MLLLPVLLVCASASVQAQGKKKCAETPIDSTNPMAPVYQECHVKQKAKPQGNPPRPEFTPNMSGSTACYRANFEFVVDVTGTPEMSTVRRVSSTDATFADAVEATIGRLRYDPARIDNAPVRQIVRYESRMSVVRTLMTASAAGGSFSPPSGSRMPRPPKC